MKVFVALPAYGGVNVCGCTLSLFKTAVALTKLGVEATIATFSSSDIAVLRNVILTLFFYRSDASHLLFVDSDLKFPPELVIDMLRFNEPLVGLVYPAKRMPIKFVAYSASPTEARMGFLKVKSIGFGVTLIRRGCVQSLIDHSPDLVRMIEDMPPSFQRESLETHGLDRVIEAFTRIDGKSEDISFCDRWRATGGSVWANIFHKVAHIGQFSFEGRLLDNLAPEVRDKIAAQCVPNAS